MTALIVIAVWLLVGIPLACFVGSELRRVGQELDQ